MSELVSVIVPCHNRKAYLRECLQSLAQQTYHNIELIVVDDASDDDLREVVNEIEFPFPQPPRYLRSDVNRGPGLSRERGRLLSVGDYICYLDSDDLWHPEKLEAQVAALRNRPEAGMCYCKTAEFHQLPITGHEELRQSNQRPVTSFLPQVLYQRPWSTSACMWRRSAIDQIGAWSSMWIWEDHEYDCRAGCHDIGIIFVDRVLCYYRLAEDQQKLSKLEMEHKAPQRALSLLEMAHQLKQYHKLAEREIRRRMDYLLFRQGMILLEHDDRRLARHCLQEIIRHDGYRSVAGLSAWLVLRAQQVLSTEQAARLGRWLRRTFLPVPVQPIT
jgi:glycosyltransferase involved in cell wall biosynthesis